MRQAARAKEILMKYDSIFYSLNSLKQGFNDWMGLSPESFTRLYTTDQDNVIVADDSSMVSLLALRGSLKYIGDAEFEAYAEKLVTILQTPLTRSCHALQFVLHYDPVTSGNTINKQFQPIKTQARNFKMDLDSVIDNASETYSKYCADEQMFIAVWTRPTVMSPAELKQARKDNVKAWTPLVNKKTQGFAVTIQRMLNIHAAAVREIADVFKDMGFKIEILENHKAIYEIRRCIAPEHTSPDWRPVLPGDPLPIRAQDPGASPYDLSNLFPPIVARQVWPCDAEIVGKKYLKIDNFIHAPMVMSLPPQTMFPFNTLFQSLRMQIPWRCSILLTGDGMRGSAVKHQISRILSLTSSNNKQFNAAYAALEESKLDGECIVAFQATFTTWVNRYEKDCMRKLSRSAQRLRTAIQSWGTCDTTDLVGDPLLAFTATVPACTPTSPAPKAIAPLNDAIRLLPISRVCSPWEFTDLPLRTPDGRFMPVGLFHSNMASWNEIAFAGMGAGKSFFLNTLNFYFVLRPGQARLPWLTIIDIGVSCSGVISLIHSALPPEKQHLVVFARLKNTKEYAINPFDTPLGCSAPLPSHLDFIINLLALLCTPIERNAPVDGVSALLREAVDTTYRLLGRNGINAKKFDRYIDPEVTSALQESGFVPDDRTTWWEVVDYLFSLEKITLAIKAQRYAMPVLADVASSCSSPLVKDAYNKINANAGGESVPEACVRYLTTAQKDYPMLSNPTRFGLGAAQIVGIDLQEVTPRGGPQSVRQSGIMYMVARFVGAAHFFYMGRDVELIPENYREYHRPRFESLAADPKRLCYDEFHRASCIDENNPLSKQIISDLTTASRESRKQNLSIGLYSQQLADFPKVLVDLATSVYALGAGNYQEAREISERFGYNNAASYALSKISRPTAAGANFVALFRTSDGESILYLTNCAGAYMKWAFSTTAEDMKVRNKLYKVLGCKKALEVLQSVYPGGSVKDEIERRKAHLEETLVGEHSTDIEEEIYNELLDRATSTVAK
jgi:intracellular multiplication protein IcmB